jgi:hypothetical protein
VLLQEEVDLREVAPDTLDELGRERRDDAPGVPPLAVRSAW